MPDLAELGISIDARAAVRGREALDRLTESAGGAERATDRLQRASRAAGVGLGLVVTGATGAVITLDRLIKRAAGFQDFADKTGAAAAGLASMQTAADVAEVPISEVAQAANRLTVSLSKVDEGSDGAARALAAIGLSVEDIRKQRPDEQLRTVAQALAGFTDGAGKAAVATALYGRGGAELLPLLKELGQETQRVTYLTNEQIAAADDYADGQARLQSQLQQLAQAAALHAAPALTALLTATRDAAEESLGLSRATDVLSSNRGVESFATSAVKSFAFVVDAGDGVVRTFQTIGTAIGATAAAASLAAEGEFRAARQALTEGANDIDRILQRSLYSDRVQKALDDMRQAVSKDGGATRSLTFVAPERAPRPQRATRSVGGGVGDFVGPEMPQSLISALRKIQDADVSKIAELREELQALLSIQAAGTGNGQAVDQAIQRVEAEIASLDPAIQGAALRQQQLNALLAATPSAQLAATRAEMQLLADALERGEISAEQFNEAATTRLNLVPEKVDDTKATDVMTDFTRRAAENIQDQLSGALYQAFKGDFDRIGDGFGDLVLRMAAEASAAELGKALFGSALGGTGGGLVGMAATFIGGLFAADGKAFGPAGVQAYAKGDIFSSPTLFQFAKGGGFNLGVMGEAGPEAVMPLERGPGGSLGVRMYGGRSQTAPAPVVNMNVEVVNNNAGQSQVRTEQTQGGGLRVIIDQVRQQLGSEIDRGQGLARNIGGRFGANGASTLKR